MQPETEDQALCDVLFHDSLELIMGGPAILESVQVVVFVLPFTNEGTKSSVSQNILLNVCRCNFLSITNIKRPPLTIEDDNRLKSTNPLPGWPSTSYIFAM